VQNQSALEGDVGFALILFFKAIFGGSILNDLFILFLEVFSLHHL
jgi:hypothetical protein